ncbi:BTAD domain-containing putative transcriptional regulator [Actinophytocola sp. KF-1]
MTNAELVATARRTPPDAAGRPNADHAMVEFRALGPVEAVVAGRLVDPGTPKQRALLALLLSRVGRPVSVDVMLEELWAGNPPPSATTSLQAYVANLRRVLEPERQPRTPARVLRTVGRGYLLESDVVEVDVTRFDECAKAGWQAWDRGDAQRALAEFEAGLALWRGQAYADVADAPYVEPEVARLEELRLSVAERRCAALLAVGAHEVAVAELEAFVQAHPLREYCCELLSRALYRAGRQADALAVLRTNKKRLAEELGIAPKPALQCLEQEILNQAPGLDRQPAPPTATTTPPATTPPAVAHQAPAPVPAPRRPADDEVLVGRETPLRQLGEALAAAAGGRGQVVAVSGEPGIGKTSLLRRFASTAPVPVVWGTCPEHVAAPPLWPWEQVLRAVGHHCPDTAVPGPVARLSAGDTRLLGDDDATLRDFEAVVQYLTDASRGTPLVVVLDHLHRADQTSLRLLAHLAGSVSAGRLLVVASYRSGEAATVAETSAALARAGMTRIELTGLSIPETRALAAGILGREVSDATAAGLRARTEGNPFFLRELVKHVAGRQHLDHPETTPVPAPVRDVVLELVAQLPEAATEVLAVAAVAGRYFAIDVVAEAASVEIEKALDVLDTAVEAGLVKEDQRRLGWFRFTHALTAEALRETTGRLRRVRLHRKIGAAAMRAWRRNAERMTHIATTSPAVPRPPAGTAPPAAPTTP